jgi:hypothetical protein
MLRHTCLLAAFVLFASASAQAEPEPRGTRALLSPETGRLAFGRAVATLDFDGDGIDEIAVADPGEDSDALPARGVVRIHVRVGADYQVFFVFDLQDAQAQFGASLAVGDFDEDGRDDLLIGAPGAGDGGGAVYLVRHTAPNATTQALLISNGSAAGGGCGSSFAVGDFDDDDNLDFATGCPYASFDGLTQAGRVQVAYGFGNGSFSLGLLSQESAGVGGGAETGDGFGRSLASGDFDCDSVDDLAIGVPFEDVDGSIAGGALHVLYGAADDGLTGTGSQLWHQGVAGVPGTSGDDDHFAWSLAAGDYDPPALVIVPCDDLAIGIPDDVENPGGSVLVLEGGNAGMTATEALSLTLADFPPQQGVFPLRSAPGTQHRLGDTLLAANLGRSRATDLAIGVEGFQGPFLSQEPGFVCIAFAQTGVGLPGAGQRCHSANDVGSDDIRFGSALAAGALEGTSARLVAGAHGEARAFVFGDALFKDGFDGNAD